MEEMKAMEAPLLEDADQDLPVNLSADISSDDNSSAESYEEVQHPNEEVAE